MEKHIARLDSYATPKAGFYKGAGEDDTRITLRMTVAGWRNASRKCLEPNRGRPVRMFRVHGLIVMGPSAVSLSPGRLPGSLYRPPCEGQLDIAFADAVDQQKRFPCRPCA
jgi:hypothetical protein